MKYPLWPVVLVTCLLFPLYSYASPANVGYYRYPALYGDTIVFTAQGDLWKVGIHGGLAQALTSHPGEESHAAISPDGKQVAFNGTYEGPFEVYMMPIVGGLPVRLTYGDGGNVVGWTSDGKILYATSAHSTLPDTQMYAVDPISHIRTAIPLSQASEGIYDPKRETLYFTRFAFQGSHTKRYKGGTTQSLWKYTTGATEAIPLTANFTGTSKSPMWWKDRLYFASDRDDTMNLWSMNPNGGDLKQLTHHSGLDVQSPSLDSGHIVYQLGADLHLFDIASSKDTTLDISISSDLDMTRERWITNPTRYLSSNAFAADGSHVALTSRGRVFVIPTAPGRLVEATRKTGVRYRNVLCTPDGKSVIAVSDESGEMEWWQLPANGIGERRQITSGSSVLPMSGEISPDGKWLAYGDKNYDLWLLNIADGKRTKIGVSDGDVISNIRWSPDSAWIAYTLPTVSFSRIMLYSMKDAKTTPLTTDRADSYDPAWSPDGKWLYFLSDRTFQSWIGAPWGARQPEPFFPNQTKVYQIALTKGLRSPFLPDDELQPHPATTKSKPPTGTPTVNIDLQGLQTRLREVPIPAGNYDTLTMNETRLFFISHDTSQDSKAHLVALDIGNEKIALKTLVNDIKDYALSSDWKHLLVHKGDDFFEADSSTGAPMSLEKRVDLSGWRFSVEPREEWREMLRDSWRLERDYFYDRKMNGIDWPAMLQKYMPLVDRIRDREELADIQSQMIGELSALHMFVFGGDVRRGTDAIPLASLGAEMSRDEAHGGCRVDKIYHGDPDYPDSLSPLVLPEVDIKVGDVIQAINGIEVLSVPDADSLLRNQAGKQVLLKVRDASDGKVRNVVTTPLSMGQEFNLRYTDWEMSRRITVEETSQNTIGYVHLRAMGAGDMSQWEKDFYPVFDRQGLIIDVRHNGGGNIDSWILEKLLRRPWFYWQGRVGAPTWNMPWAFRGHIVVLCDERTGSDGEAFAEGFRRLGLGKVIGTRTWGGEIWLSSSNTLEDEGIATAAEIGVYGPEGKWLIEGHGVDPDIVVDNLPHATFLGEDLQLKTAVTYLQKEIHDHPIPIPTTPPYPNKSDIPHKK